VTTPRPSSEAPRLRRRPLAPPSNLVQQANATHGSFELVLSPIVLALIGLWLDHSVLHSTPVCTIVFAVVGLAGAVVKLYYGYRARMDQLAADRRGGQPS
jgi:F0F1-type ATP synthase assembly protein I